MNFRKFLASALALPTTLCLMAQPLSADPVAPPVPEIDVQQPTGNSLVDGETKVSFGIVAIGTSSKAKKFTIKNFGNGKLTDIKVIRDGKTPKDFKIVHPAKTTLLPGASTTFTVTFKPTAKGIRSAAIHIKSNDADEASFDILLTGRGKLP